MTRGDTPARDPADAGLRAGDPGDWGAEKRRLFDGIEAALQGLEARERERFIGMPPDAPGADHCLSRIGAIQEVRDAVVKVFQSGGAHHE